LTTLTLFLECVRALHVLHFAPHALGSVVLCSAQCGV